jgi:hypothetical protein
VVKVVVSERALIGLVGEGVFNVSQFDRTYGKWEDVIAVDRVELGTEFSEVNHHWVAPVQCLQSK